MKLEFIEITAAESGKKNKPHVRGIAYTGGKMDVGWYYPVVVDLSGIEFAPQVVLLANHKNETQSRIGIINPEIRDGAVYIDGEIVSTSGTALGIIEQARAGADWQLSIGATPTAREFVDVDYTRVVNGVEHSGPFYHVQKSILKEVSVVAIGADNNTNMTVEASFKMEGIMPKPKDNKNGTPPAGASAADPNANIEAAAENIQAAENGAASAAPAGQEKQPDIKAAAPAVPAAPAAPVNIQAAVNDGIQAERARVAMIGDICAGEYPELQAQAIREGWDENKVNTAVLAKLRENRPSAPNAIIAGRSTDGEDIFKVLEASALMSGGLPIDQVAKITSDKVVSAAQRKYPAGLGLQALLLEAAWRGGYVGTAIRGHEREVLQAAFSTMSLPGIMSNVANKFLLASFMAVEATWQKIAAVSTVNDFKRKTSYRLTGNMEFDEVGPDGELKHGELGEESFGNQAKTYGKLFSITRNDIINDDLGALTAVPKMIGRGCALKVNKVFWKEFLANSAYFTVDHKNLITGTGSALSIAALSAARTKFAEQVDSNGDPLGATPKFNLVPPALLDLAKQLYVDTKVAGGDGSKTDSNPNAGMVEPVSSQYLSNSNMTGYSTTAWYLLADPLDLPFIEIVFLNGNRTPVVESTAADFDTLGIKFRGYFDFGVEKQDYRAAQKNTGVE